MNTLLNHMKNNSLINIDKPVVIAVSSGVDSMVLLDILLRLNHTCIIAHVNHQKRPESDDEYSYLQAYAKQKNIPFEGKTLDLKTGNFHDEAHHERLAFFKLVALKYKTDQIVLAHHLDDQIETILMRVIRGTRFENYAGINPSYKQDGFQFIRPFLDIEKNDILSYAKQYDVHYFEDASNFEDTYTRNRYRHKLIPFIQQENPNYKVKVLQLSDMIKQATKLIKSNSHSFISSLKDPLIIPLESFNQLNKLVQIDVLTTLINQITDNSVEVSYSQYEDMLGLCHSSKSNLLYTLSSDYSFVKNYDSFTIKTPEIPFTKCIEINDFGTYDVTPNLSYLFTPNKIDQNHRNYFELWYNELVFPLYLRTRKNGDRMHLKVGTKKIKDILIDQKIPIQSRDTLMCLTDAQNVLWIPGIKKSKQDIKKKNKLYVYEVTKC